MLMKHGKYNKIYSVWNGFLSLTWDNALKAMSNSILKKIVNTILIGNNKLKLKDQDYKITWEKLKDRSVQH